MTGSGLPISHRTRRAFERIVGAGELRVRPLAACGWLLASLLVIGGCGRADDGAAGALQHDAASGDLGHVALPTGWRWAEGSGIPHVLAKPSLPTVVTDGAGEQASVTDIAKVIVGGEDVADVLAAMGLAGNIYAAPTNSVAAAAVNAPLHFELSQKTGSEGLLAIKGTLFIGNNLKRHDSVAVQFRNAGVAAVVLDNHLPIPDKIRAIGRYVGAADAGGQLAEAVQAQLDQARASAGDSVRHLRVLVVTAKGAGGANAVVGNGTAAADMIGAIGATNIGGEMGLSGYSVKFSGEGLLKANPDVIVMGDGDLDAWHGIEGFKAAFPTLALTRAGQLNHYVVMPSEQIKVSGVGTGAGAVALAQALKAVRQ